MALSKEQIKQILESPYKMGNILSADNTRQVQLYLLESNESPDVCVRIASYSVWAESMLRGLAEHYRTKPEMKGAWILAMCNIPPELVGKRNPIKWDVIRDLMNDAEVLVYIADEALPELFNSPIVERLNWNLYWLFRFNAFMKRKNYKRAWDLIKKARLGFLDEANLPKGTCAFDDAFVDQEYRYHSASDSTITSMVRRLFEAMVKSGTLQPLPTTRPDWGKLHSRIPGIHVANTVTDLATGHQALVIGAHFSNTTNIKKRSKLMREIALA